MTIKRKSSPISNDIIEKHPIEAAPAIQHKEAKKTILSHSCLERNWFLKIVAFLLYPLIQIHHGTTKSAHFQNILLSFFPAKTCKVRSQQLHVNEGSPTLITRTKSLLHISHVIGTCKKQWLWVSSLLKHKTQMFGDKALWSLLTWSKTQAWHQA